VSRILVVEDKSSLRQMLRATLEGAGYEVETAAEGKAALRALQERRYLLVITDLRLPGADGMKVLRQARESDPDLPVLMMTGYGSVELAVEAMKEGAVDFLTKPVDMDHLLLLIGRVVDQRRLQFENLLFREIFAETMGFPRIIGADSGLKDILAQTRKVAPTVATVLITGESGTGKELIARAIHHLSGRQDRPFVAINCAAIPATLLESELFGHERGAFTGAVALKKGKFELADGGTLFLDEIGEIPPEIQPKILRMLQEKTFERVGGTETIGADVRILAATNRELTARIRDGGFRQDLYFRLNVFPVHMPPLRARRGDIPLLAEEFVKRFSREVRQRPEMTLTDEAVELLAAHDWPGNIRELENCIERAVILANGSEITASLLSIGQSPSLGGRPGDADTFRQLVDLDGTLAEAAGRAAALAEKIKIRQALEESGGVRSHAAQSLGVSQKTLLAKIRDHGLEEAGGNEPPAP
jgi:DNA-binding NtrC family response regulator